MTDTSAADSFLIRLDAVSARFASHAAETPSDHALTAPDPSSGERWDSGQVWAHCAEFVPYWIEQARIVIGSYEGEPVPFGRTKVDEGRITAIERDRRQPVAVLWSETHSGIERLRHMLAALDSAAWDTRGLHPSLGVMRMERVVEEFLVGHLEQHADQLDEVARA
ncbi:MAG: DinB family protein [Candidatus Dormibacteraeota bacterium]|nr:DinB family protein [Candidatus Dormibacteraeota bacterium]